MTLTELKATVQARGLETALDEISLAKVPEDVREEWFAASQAMDNWNRWKRALLRALREED